jgi:nitrite reductase/ring-hydroxylating ferredoxin subunit
VEDATHQVADPTGWQEKRIVIKVCAVADLSVGEALRVELPIPIAVFNVAGDFYAIDDTCTHQDASLADGSLEDDCTVECPLHASCFDLRTGKSSGPPAKLSVRTHTVVVEGDTVFVVPRLP